jgi:hypothetical protein
MKPRLIGALVALIAIFGLTAGSCAKPPATYQHVVVIMMENRTWSGVGGPGFGDRAMPDLHGLARNNAYFLYWTETNTAQSSLTQYIGLTSGINNPRTVNDCDPSAICRSTDNNIFRQVRQSGGKARSYVEGATAGCSASGNAAEHIPALYYYGTYSSVKTTVSDHTYCSTEVRPLTEMDVNHLPTFAMVTPTLCHDGHDCDNATVDATAKRWVDAIMAGADYKAGNTAIMVLWDEDHPVPNLLIAPTAHSGALATIGAGHSAMLRTWDEMLHLPVLPSVSGSISLRGPAHI